MRKVSYILLPLTILITIIFNSSIVLAFEDRDSLKANAKIQLLEEKVSQLELETTELKKTKNEQKDALTRFEKKYLTLAAITTLVSLFLILFVFMYLSIRRRRRIDIASLQDKIKKQEIA